MKRLVLPGFLAFCTVLPAMAEYPTDAYFLANKTYTGAATQANLGVTSGTVTANAWYKIDPTYYLPNNKATVASCVAGYYCPGVAAVSVGASSASSTMITCPKDTYSTGSASSCTPCASPYGTSNATGSTSAAACKKDVEFYAYGASGNLTTTAGTIATASSGWWNLTCTQGQSCVVPNASGLSGNGLTFSGGWYTGQPSSNPTTTSNCTVAAGSTVTNFGSSYFACWQPTSFVIPLVVLSGYSDTSGNTLNRGTTELYYYYYNTPHDSGSGTDVRKVFSGCNKVNNECPPNSLTGELNATLSKITPPSWEGHVFYGYWTEPGYGNSGGQQLIASDGELNATGATFLSAFSKPTSTNTLDHMLYAHWSADVTCPKGKFLNKMYSDCLPCEMGSYCPGGHFDSTSQGDYPGLFTCPKGTYSDVKGLSECKSCYSGYSTSGTGSTIKSDCKKKITLNKSDGSGKITSDGGAEYTGTNVGYTFCSEGSNCALPATSELTQDGYSFKDSNNTNGFGWSTTQGCTSGKFSFSDAEIKANTVFYACKQGKGITINWTGVDGGTGDTKATSTSVTYGGNIVTPAKAFTVTGQKFLGWKFVKTN